MVGLHIAYLHTYMHTCILVLDTLAVICVYNICYILRAMYFLLGIEEDKCQVYCPTAQNPIAILLVP